MASKKDNTSNNSEDKPIIQKDTASESQYLSQKCKRLASALYAVTRFLPADEPVRDRIRDNALSLVDSVNSSARYTPQNSTPSEVLSRIRDQLTVAKDGGLLSPMNHHVLTEEIAQLTDQLNASSAGPGPLLNDSYLAVEGNLSQGNRNTFRSRSSNTMPAGQTDANQDSTSESTKSSAGQSAKEKRRQKILDLFAETDEITVNDATEVIDGYSTKTIQRDLKALVEDGKLKKHGKRRWTSYTRA